MDSELHVPSSAPGLAERLATVRAGIAEAASVAGRTEDTITTVVVTKFQPVSLIEELAALGVRDVGENRHQEAEAKAAELSALGLTWHFVGQVQGKKARQVRRYARVIHSVDRESLVTALDAPDPAGQDAAASVASTPVIDCFVQVNLTDDAARGGVSPAGLEPLIEQVLRSSRLNLLGLMAVAPLGTEPRKAFAGVRELSERVRRIAPSATSLSMGMSQDYREAVAEGATHLRIGSAITGNRPVHG
jgi:pyridoxal phosphate enzyme (YggS family)